MWFEMRRVQQRTAQLEAMNQELEAFAYSVSHDLRAPLRSVDGYSRALKEEHGAGLDEQANFLLSRILKSSQRMGELIDDLLRLSRLSRTEIHRGPVDFSALAQSIAQELQREEPERQVYFSFE